MCHLTPNRKTPLGVGVPCLRVALAAACAVRPAPACCCSCVLSLLPLRPGVLVGDGGGRGHSSGTTSLVQVTALRP